MPLDYCINVVLPVVFFISVKWQLYLSNCSGPKPWCHTLYPINGKIPLALPSKYIWSLISSRYLHPIPTQATSIPRWVIAVASLASLLPPGPPRSVLKTVATMTLFLSQLMPFFCSELCVSQSLTTLWWCTGRFQTHSQAPLQVYLPCPFPCFIFLHCIHRHLIFYVFYLLWKFPEGRNVYVLFFLILA